MYLGFSILLAVAPAIVLVVYYYRQDNKRPEPKRLILRIFALGILSIIPSVFLEIIITSLSSLLAVYPVIHAAFQAFIVAALVEELMKFLVIRYFAFPRAEFDEVLDGIIYGVVASLGFACLENIVYVIGGGFQTALIRAFTSVPLHAFASGLMGFYIGKARFAKSKSERNKLMTRGLLIAVMIHGTYDFLLFSTPFWGFLPVLLIIPLLIGSYKALQNRISIAKELDNFR